MHTQASSQSRIIAYGKDSTSGLLVPLQISSGALDVNVVSPDPLPVSFVNVYKPPTNYPDTKTLTPPTDYFFTIYGAQDGSSEGIFLFTVDSTCSATAYVKFFSGSLPLPGANPVLQFPIEANGSLKLSPGAAPILLTNATVVYIEDTPGQLLESPFTDGTMIVNYTHGHYIP